MASQSDLYGPLKIVYRSIWKYHLLQCLLWSISEQLFWQAWSSCDVDDASTDFGPSESVLPMTYLTASGSSLATYRSDTGQARQHLTSEFATCQTLPPVAWHHINSLYFDSKSNLLVFTKTEQKVAEQQSLLASAGIKDSSHLVGAVFAVMWRRITHPESPWLPAKGGEKGGKGTRDHPNWRSMGPNLLTMNSCFVEDTTLRDFRLELKSSSLGLLLGNIYRNR